MEGKKNVLCDELALRRGGFVKIAISQRLRGCLGEGSFRGCCELVLFLKAAEPDFSPPPPSPLSALCSKRSASARGEDGVPFWASIFGKKGVKKIREKTPFCCGEHRSPELRAAPRSGAEVLVGVQRGKKGFLLFSFMAN